MKKTLRLILGDQLNIKHSWYSNEEDDVHYVMMEMRQETDYVKHHIQKIIAFFLSMRKFAGALEKMGKNILYLKLDSADNHQDLIKNLNTIIKDKSIEKFEYQLPDEYRLDKQLRDFCEQLDITYDAYDTEHFLTSRDELAEFFKGKKTYLMESFYRYMRKKHDVLMDGASKPLGDKWNYDHENRKSFQGEVDTPEPIVYEEELSRMKEMIDAAGVKYIGTLNTDQWIWPSSRKQAMAALDDFIANRLPHFGRFQDAMHMKEKTLFHSLLSFALNSKMIHPLDVIKKAEQAYLNDSTKYHLADVEGFIRQILGWREYMRGIYWAKMPEYANLNYFDFQRKLPDFYWTGQTKMKCLSHAIDQSLDTAYAHHIQRLMITGNFALLAMVHPDEVDQWYLGIYIDAIEWVEITNTRGMSQFADGGIVGSKPYVSSANYIDKMSNYCKSCHYAKNQKTGEKACPFNSLYWNFYHVNREKLEKNPRIGMMYRTWDKMASEQKEALLKQANDYLNNIDSL